jgi:hypothetical protein
MSFYPILKAPYCTGKTTLYNFPPNNWESAYKGRQFINLTYTHDGMWHSKVLGELEYGDCKIIYNSDVIDLMPENTLPLLSLTKDILAPSSKTLPKLTSNTTHAPAYRATLALESRSWATTSYQGEINPFPSQASLLSFSPFLQFGKQVENYVLLLNIEKQPNNREVVVKIYDANSRALKGAKSAMSNNISFISLDNLGFDVDNLPVVICDEMAAIPLYFSCVNQGEFLSLEHTHPPASLVVHGNRFSVQKHLKKYWFSQFSV